jgi:hypothetical protein
VAGFSFLILYFPNQFRGTKMQRYPMTPEGKVALEKELQQLKTVDRPRIIQAIAEAREHGD